MTRTGRHPAAESRRSRRRSASKAAGVPARVIRRTTRLPAGALVAVSVLVNAYWVAPVLFARYPTVSDLAEADPEEVEQIVYSTGFYRQKTKSIIKLAQGIEEIFAGEVPMDIEALVQLPGVGRKTASVLLAEAWGVPPASSALKRRTRSAASFLRCSSS